MFQTADQKIRLIATDVDGTLLPEGTSDLDPKLYEIIRALKDKGVTTVIGSGRGYGSVSRLFKPVINDVLFMVQNGSFTMDGENMLYSLTIERDVLEEIVRYVRRQDPEKIVFWMLAGTKKQYTEVKNEEYTRRFEEGYGVHYERVEDVLAVNDPTLLKCAVYTLDDAAELAKELNRLFGDRVTVTPSGAHWVDCNPVGADKGEGLRRIQEYLGVTYEETMAFGDNTNDVPMLRSAKWSFAVEEGRPEAREAAAFSAGKMSEKGVQRILEQLLQEL